MRPTDFIEFHLERAELTEDGFCGICDEFYSDCECKGLFARLYKNEVEKNKKSKEELKKLKKELKKLLEVKNV